MPSKKTNIYEVRTNQETGHIESMIPEGDEIQEEALTESDAQQHPNHGKYVDRHVTMKMKKR